MSPLQPRLVETPRLIFPEGPRWKGGKLWFTDVHAKAVYTWEPRTSAMEKIADVEGWPAGIGFRTDGRMIVSSMLDGLLLQQDGHGGLEVLTDLSPLATPLFGILYINDLVVDSRGNSYVNIYGLGGEQDNGGIALVRPDGEIEIVAENLAFPNGMVVTPDLRTLIVAELHSDVLTAYDVDDDGRLSNRRLWAQIPGATPDGICLDAEGAVWVGSAYTGHFYRVAEGGDVLADIVMPDTWTVAPALGGDDGKTLFLMTCVATREEQAAGKGKGYLHQLTVDVAGVGCP
ncbi:MULTISPECIES: SMP-30/gluconolactonase/LRE family protein [unclassified Microbacterium]|uniref:SMP-30/gluconolactonase/LRE family protein n=1 Tax=unclassified Microbacterium TaxID=2609290 RepID=UPI000C2C1AC3|nr:MULTISPECIES: SMP-30/gluconolactonase/LRE family protein [unclassified Microbacterium]